MGAFLTLLAKAALAFFLAGVICGLIWDAVRTFT
jgi:hypothetical protein